VAGNFPHLDCTHWLSMGLDEAMRSFPVELPAVRVVSTLIATADAFEATLV